MRSRQPRAAQEPAQDADGYSAMVASMQEHRAAEYDRARVKAMADQHSRFEDRSLQRLPPDLQRSSCGFLPAK